MSNDLVVKTKSREIEFDCLRIVAILAVIMIHCSAPFVIQFPKGSFNFAVANLLDSISRIGVPFFVIISGYFLLNENRDISAAKIKSKVCKMFFILGAWSLFYALLYNCKNFFNAFIYGHYHLWYLYMMIGLYLTTPILRLFVKKENKNYIYYLVALSLIFCFTPPLLSILFSNDNEITKLANQFQISFAGAFVSYYLIGWLFGQDYSLFKKRIKMCVLIAIAAIIFIFCGVQFVETKIVPYKVFYANTVLPVFIYSISSFLALYEFFKQIKSKFSEKVKTFISEMSKLTFGVYLVHISLLELFKNEFKYNSEINAIAYIFFIYAITTISSFIVAFLLSKIKYINQLIKL